MILIFISEVGSICWWVDTPGVDTYKFDTKTFKSNCFRNFLSTFKLRVFHDFQSGKLFVPTGWYITTEQKFDYFSIKFSNGLSSMNIYISLFAFEFFFYTIDLHKDDTNTKSLLNRALLFTIFSRKNEALDIKTLHFMFFKIERETLTNLYKVSNSLRRVKKRFIKSLWILNVSYYVH